jgi:hypothetical protein
MPRNQYRNASGGLRDASKPGGVRLSPRAEAFLSKMKAKGGRSSKSLMARGIGEGKENHERHNPLIGLGKPARRAQQACVDLLSDALEEALKGRITSAAIVVCMDDGIGTVMAGKNGGALNIGCDDLKLKIHAAMFEDGNVGQVQEQDREGAVSDVTSPEQRAYARLSPIGMRALVCEADTGVCSTRAFRAAR